MNQSTSEPRPQRNDSRLIPLTQGQFAIVDAADYEWLNQWKWCALWNKRTQSFYATRRTGPTPGIVIYMHRFILGLNYGDSRQVDHKHSGQTLDNRRYNLRIATCVQNNYNRRRRTDNRSGFKGVTAHGGKWQARINKDGRRISLGHFSTAEEAHAAYSEAAKKYYGEFART
jgi:hypothetical protein